MHFKPTPSRHGGPSTEARSGEDERQKSRHEKQSPEIDVYRQELQRMTEVNDKLNQELIKIKKERDEMKALADIRGRQLASNPRTHGDRLSISDLKNQAVMLNDEIFQAAVPLAETITLHQVHDLTTEDKDTMYNDVVQLIGEPIALVLVEEAQKSNVSTNPLLVQVVLQFFITNFCASMIELWAPNDPKISNFLTTTYSRIRDDEEQAVSGRWRALTQQYTRPGTAGWKEDLVAGLMNIIKIAAWKRPGREDRLSFESKLVHVFKAAQDLRIVIKEQFVSADVHVSLVPPNSEFMPDCMDDVFADVRMKAVRGGPIQRVIGTTGPGLKAVDPKYDGSSGDALHINLLAPSVLLESTLMDALKRDVPGMCGKD